jgi:hypothetical protein
MNIDKILSQVARDRSGPCEDDCEVTAPWIGICPDETEGEEPSPLDFGGEVRSASSYFDSNQERWAHDARQLRIAAKRAAALCDDM